jgi:hypothetical protein
MCGRACCHDDGGSCGCAQSSGPIFFHRGSYNNNSPGTFRYNLVNMTALHMGFPYISSNAYIAWTAIVGTTWAAYVNADIAANVLFYMTEFPCYSEIFEKFLDYEASESIKTFSFSDSHALRLEFFFFFIFRMLLEYGSCCVRMTPISLGSWDILDYSVYEDAAGNS